MKKTFLALWVGILCSINTFSQEGIKINNTFTSDTILEPFNDVPAFYSFRIKCNVDMNTDTSLVRIILKDSLGNELLIYEDYALIHNDDFSDVNNYAEETFYLPRTKGQSIVIEMEQASLFLDYFEYYTDSIDDSQRLNTQHLLELNNAKIDEINSKISNTGMLWFAGITPYSGYTYMQKKQFWGDRYNLEGYDYYIGGLYIEMSNMAMLTYPGMLLPQSFDWRTRHGANNPNSPYFDGDPDYTWNNIHETGNGWMTGVRTQYNPLCPNTCYIYGPLAAFEAVANLYFNQHLDFDLSEQEIFSCFAGECGGGTTFLVDQAVRDNGVSSESCFPYHHDLDLETILCSEKCVNPPYNFKISGFSVFQMPSNKDDLKRILISKGPCHFSTSGHVMCLLGWGTVHAYDVIHCGNGWTPSILVLPGNPLIGTNYWIVKNSGDIGFGDQGYLYLIDNNSSTSQDIFFDITSITTPIIIDSQNPPTVNCNDLDGDGYYWWGIGDKPASCQCSPYEDSDDSDAGIGPYDENYFGITNIVDCSTFTKNATPLTISTNTNWATEIAVNQDVIVTGNATLTITSKINLEQTVNITVENGAHLTIDGGELWGVCYPWHGTLKVNGGGTLTLTNAAKIHINGTGKLWVDKDANGNGTLNWGNDVNIRLYDEESNIEIKGILNILPYCNFTYTGQGYVLFSSPDNPSNNITYGSGSSITLSGSGQSDKIMEIAQETVYMPNCTLSNGLVYMQNSIARMQAATETTTMSLNNIKFSPLGTTRTNHRGLYVWGNQTCTITTCTFEKGQYGIYGWLSYGGNPLHIESCTFDNNSTGLWIHGKEIQLLCNEIVGLPGQTFNYDCNTFQDNTTGFYGEYADDGFEGNIFKGCTFTNNLYPFRYVNAQGDLLIENSIITGAASSCVYVTGNHCLNIKCSEITGATGSGNPAVYICSGASLAMTPGSENGKCKLSGPIALRLNGAYQFDIYNGKNYFIPTSSYHIYGTITKYSSCPPTISFDVSNNQWNANNTNFTSGMAYVFKSGCSTAYTLTSTAPYEYFLCGSGINKNSYISSDSIRLVNNANHTNNWRTSFNSYAQTFAGNVPVTNQQNVELWESSWENMRFCLKKMYGLKQLNGISNSEFNQTMLANHKMQQLQRDNYYRLFQLKLEKATLYRMAGNYNKAIELVEELTSDTCSSHKEQADAWLCMLQLEKRIAQGLIPPSRIEIERANCPMFQEPVEEQTKSFQNNSPEINIENSSWIKIVPNPASEQATLCVNSESENPCEVEITNVLGEYVETISVTEGYSERVVSLDKYSKGIYIASLIINGKTAVIQRFSVVK